MKQRQFLALWIAAVLILAAGCGGGSSSGTSQASSSSGGGIESMYTGAYDAEEPASISMSQTSNSSTESSVYQNAGAKLIRRAELSIQTSEFDQAVNALDELVIAHGGYYESASVYGGSYRNANASRSGEYVVRVPAEQFQAFKSSAGELGYVTSSTESSEDVGELYYDAEARLKTQRTKQERLLNLLEQAATMEDIIDLENALSDVEYEIEQLSSTLNRYDALISYSTFRIYLNEVASVTEQVGETASLGQKLAAGFAASGTGLVRGTQDLLIWVSYHIFGILVFLAVAGVTVTVGVRKLKAEKSKRSQNGENKTE